VFGVLQLLQTVIARINLSRCFCAAETTVVWVLEIEGQKESVPLRVFIGVSMIRFISPLPNRQITIYQAKKMNPSSQVICGFLGLPHYVHEP